MTSQYYQQTIYENNLFFKYIIVHSMVKIALFYGVGSNRNGYYSRYPEKLYIITLLTLEFVKYHYYILGH